MKTLYININKGSIENSTEVEVLSFDLQNDFYYSLGESIKGKVRGVSSNIDLVGKYVESGESSKFIEEAWKTVKEGLFSENPEEDVAITLPQSYLEWLRYNNDESFRNIYEQLYSGQRSASVTINMEELYEDAISGTLYRQIRNYLRNNTDIEEFVFNDNCVSRKSSIVRQLKEKFEDLGFVPFEKWEGETMQSQIAEDVEEKTSTDIVAGHRMVDLGLSVCWADCNVGANSPEEYGGCFDLKNYDRAVCDWEPEWRLPTKKEIEELCKKCAWVWTKINGVSGFTIIGPNENKIFLPAAGYNETGNYWSTTKFERNGHHGAYYLRFFISSDENRCYFCYADCERNEKRSIRAVIDRNI